MMIGFQDRFVPMVEDGSKTHTIRGWRKRPFKAGDVGNLYQRPRQRDMRLIFNAPVIRVQRIEISAACWAGRLLVEIDGEKLAADEADAFFWRDGFRPDFGKAQTVVEKRKVLTATVHPSMRMARAFWKSLEREPFAGQLIHWDFAKRDFTPASRKQEGC